MFGIQSTDLEYEYRGYEYRTYRDVEEDNIKLWHLCYKDGKEVEMPQAFINHSPYSTWSKEEFAQFIDSQILVDFVLHKDSCACEVCRGSDSVDILVR